MNKWVDLIDNGGEWKCMINLDNVTRICNAQVQREPRIVYFIIFKSENKELGHVSYRFKETRDREYENIFNFLCNENKSVMRLATDID